MTSNGLCNTRRHFLQQGTMGIGAVALAWLLKQEKLLAEAPVMPELEVRKYDLTPKPPVLKARARAMISLFMVGGPSQMDLFDPKPALDKYDGKPFPGEIKYDNVAQASSKVLASPWKFSRHEQCGMELSELLPWLGKAADHITLVRSMHTGVNNHGQSVYALNTGRPIGGRPALGSWITYGLGSESQNLPAFVALTHPHGMPLLGGENWSNAWLPSAYQGTLVRPTEPHILNLDPPAQLRGDPQRSQLAFLRKLDQEHADKRPGESDLEARIASFELAARMQTAAKEALDISTESDATKRLYGIDNPVTKDYATRCLIARRLVERGVRFVQVFNNGQTWDHHDHLVSALPARCAEIDQPAAALVMDLASRGMLDETVVHFGGEMGRLPVIQNDAGRDKVGRDHNTYGFSMWLAGGGFKGGYVHGETDEFGHRAVKDVVNHFDYHATLLNLFGLDHERLVYKRNGQKLTLTDGQVARVVRELLA
ncbi:MAG TPA: DUF1501 domain-containing protein [Tepidisphaeraceae bacterium]|jgi:hypothetical protein